MYRKLVKDGMTPPKPKYENLDSFDYCYGVVTNRIKVCFVLGNMVFGTLQECQAMQRRCGGVMYIKVNEEVTKL